MFGGHSSLSKTDVSRLLVPLIHDLNRCLRWNSLSQKEITVKKGAENVTECGIGPRKSRKTWKCVMTLRILVYSMFFIVCWLHFKELFEERRHFQNIYPHFQQGKCAENFKRVFSTTKTIEYQPRYGSDMLKRPSTLMIRKIVYLMGSASDL